MIGVAEVEVGTADTVIQLALLDEVGRLVLHDPDGETLTTGRSLLQDDRTVVAHVESEDAVDRTTLNEGLLVPVPVLADQLGVDVASKDFFTVYNLDGHVVVDVGHGVLLLRVLVGEVVGLGVEAARVAQCHVLLDLGHPLLDTLVDGTVGATGVAGGEGVVVHGVDVLAVVVGAVDGVDILTGEERAGGVSVDEVDADGVDVVVHDFLSCCICTNYTYSQGH